jgi:CheY-like chemotaxis protein
VTGYPDDLAGLYGTPECPVLVIAKPFRQHQIEEAISLALQPRLDTPTLASTPVPERRPVLVTDVDEETRALLRRWVSDYGFEVEEAATGGQALQALQRRQFGHVFLDLHMPGSGPQFGNAISEAHPHTTVVISTAYPEDLFPLSGTVTVLRKPFNLDGLRASLELRRTPIH